MSGRLGLRKKKKERGKTGENHDNECIRELELQVEHLNDQDG